MDEFQLEYGNFYVVCRMYADLWALCAKVSLDQLSDQEDGQTNMAFLPLCAVTLAANFSAYVTRCDRRLNSPYNEPIHPGNGLSVIPPERSHSLNAGKQIFHGMSLGFGPPAIAYNAHSLLSPEGTEADFEPLDSTLKQLLEEMGRSEGKSTFRSDLLLKKIWHWRGLRSDHSESANAVRVEGATGASNIFRRNSYKARVGLVSAGKNLKHLAKNSYSSLSSSTSTSVSGSTRSTRPADDYYPLKV